MRYLSRSMVVVCVAALLLALPAQALPQRTHDTAAVSSSPAISAWLDSLWGELVRLFAPGNRQPGRPGTQPNKTNLTALPQAISNTQGGSCIDPDGCS
jgi:hypothetical protein